MLNAFKIIKFFGGLLLPIFSISFLNIGTPTRLPQISGYTEITASVGENGESTAHIPISIPKGTVLAPELGIGYSSQASNGLLGQGFQLEGLYSISRTAANKAQDGYLHGLAFDTLDRFSLNGERLVLVSGASYGGEGVEYRTEQNNFSRVRSYGRAGRAPASFKVWTKSGLVMEFGHTTDARIEASVDSIDTNSFGAIVKRTDTYMWMVNKIADTKGNYITFSYIKEPIKGEFRIDKIQYTGNAATGLLPYNLIQFTYESRPDSTVAYLASSKIGSSKRLQEITVMDNGVQYRRYELQYYPATDLGLGNKSFLKSIKEFGVGNISFEPTTFKWTNRNVFPSQEIFNSNAHADLSNQPDKIRTGDVTGDGKADIVIGPNSTTNQWYVMRSTGTSFVNELWASNTPAAWGTMPQSAIRLMDVNSDGLQDIVVGPDNTGKWEVMKSTGNSFSPAETWCVGAYSRFYNTLNTPNLRIWDMDIDGDGKQDIVLCGNTEQSQSYFTWYLLKNTGTSFIDKGRVSNSLIYNGTQPNMLYPMDINGDGLIDFMEGPMGYRWATFSNNSSSFAIDFGGGGLFFSAFYNNNNQTDRYWQIDFEGDGLQDLVFGPEQITGNWFLFRNKGNGTFEDMGVIASNKYASWFDKADRIRTQDLNGDGLTDFLFGPEQGTGNWYCMYNTGKGFELGYDGGVWLYGAYENWWDKPQLIRQMDVNGDGVLDICFGPEATTGKWEVMTNRISQNHPLLLESMTNGHGATTEFVYKPLTNPDVYQKGTGAVFPKMDFIAPLFVVNEVRTDNGIGGQNSIFYKYYDAKLDLGGRGFRGFGKTEEIDSVRGTKNVIIYERQHQFLSAKVSANEQWLLNYNGSPKLLHSRETLLDTFEYFNKTVHFAYVKGTTEKTYDLNSPNPIQTKVTHSIYDRNWGNVTQVSDETKVGNTTQYTVVTNNTYAAPDTVGEHWILGRLTLASVTKTVTGKPSITKQSTFAYESSSGILTQEILLSTSNTLKLQKDYTLDAYGNRLTETVSAPNITARTTTFRYDDKNRLVTKVKNPLNQEVNYTYQNGLPYATTEPNGLTETVDRDPFGRPTTVFHPDGTQTSTKYFKCDGTQADAPPQYAVHYKETEKAGNGKNHIFYDILDREIRRVNYGLDGQLFYVDTEYDVKGLVKRKSDPYRNTPTWHTYQYDAVFRVVQQTDPGNLTSSVQYTGLTTLYTNAQSQNTTRITNAMGWLIQSKDNQNNSIVYDYDSDGNTTTVTDPVGNVTTMTYDSRGNKTSMQDLDLGLLTYEYNTLGQMTKQTYGGGQTIAITYDLLDRKIEQIEKKNATLIERTLNWTYDVGNKGIGRLTSESINGVVAKQYLYDNFGRLLEEKDKIESIDYSTTYEYDAFGRIQFLNYPAITDFRLRYNYDVYGHLKSICQPNATNGNCATTFWQLDSLNNRGQATKMILGNGLVTRKTFNDSTAYLQTIRTGNNANPALIQNLSYQFSTLGNLTQRKDIGNNLTENFEYDNLNRLTQAQVVGQDAVTTQFNAIGNITFKSNVGTYTYGQNGAGPHMVTTINHAGVANCFYGFQGNVAYSVYNYPLKITDNTDNITFTYDANRAKQTQSLVKDGVLQWKKQYINSLAERIEEGGIIKTMLYIKAMGETVAVLKKQVGAPDTLRYMHYDHLGSLQTMSRADGTLENTFSYDAWGKPRQALSWQPYLTKAPLPPFQQGFTMHEMMGIEDLVHMNARLYDPAIGRVVSADPVVQAPDDLQSFNRASYVFNNPLSYTDPSGFKGLKLNKIVNTTVNFARANSGTLITIAIAAALAPATGGTSLGWAIASGAIAGFGGAFAGTLINKGDVNDAFRNGLKAGAIGALSAGIGHEIGTIFQGLSQSGALSGLANIGTKALAHGVSQGIIQGAASEYDDGEFATGFKSGFISGFASASAGSQIDRLDNFGLRIASAATLGGTVSVLTGGKFANGAVTGAFVRLFNDEGHKESKIKKAFDTAMKVAEGAMSKAESLVSRYAPGQAKVFFEGANKAFMALNVAGVAWDVANGDYGNALVGGVGIAAGVACGASVGCGVIVGGAGLAADYYGVGDNLGNLINKTTPNDNKQLFDNFSSKL